MQKHVNLVDPAKSFPTHILLQNLASIQTRKSLSKFVYFSHNYPAQRFNFHIGTTPGGARRQKQRDTSRDTTLDTTWFFRQTSQTRRSYEGNKGEQGRGGASEGPLPRARALECGTSSQSIGAAEACRSSNAAEAQTQPKLKHRRAGGSEQPQCGLCAGLVRFSDSDHSSE